MGHSGMLTFSEQDLAERKRIESLHDKIDFISPIEQTLSRSGRIRIVYSKWAERTFPIIIGNLPKNTPIITRFRIEDLPSQISQPLITELYKKTEFQRISQRISYLINKCFENVDIYSI